MTANTNTIDDAGAVDEDFRESFVAAMKPIDDLEVFPGNEVSNDESEDRLRVGIVT